MAESERLAACLPRAAGSERCTGPFSFPAATRAAAAAKAAERRPRFMKYPGKYGTPWRQLRALTLEEKASLLSGHGFWRTKAIPEKRREKPVYGRRAARRAQRG